MERDRLKKYLGIEDDTKDSILDFIISDVEEMIKNYCNVCDIPEGLLNTSYRMAIDLYRNENIGHEESALCVSSISEGDTSISFGANTADDFKGSLLKKYKSTLNRYRKVVFK